MTLKFSRVLVVAVFALLAFVALACERAPAAETASVSAAPSYSSLVWADEANVTTRAVTADVETVAIAHGTVCLPSATNGRVVMQAQPMFIETPAVYRRIERGPPDLRLSAVRASTTTSGFSGVGYVHFARADI